MRNILNLAKVKIANTFQSESSLPIFLMGQAAILSSRSYSHTFKDLWDSEVKIYSQWGEDGILDYLCERISLSKPRILEVGAGNFTECNSRFLAENRNASVFAVDGRRDLITTLERDALTWKSHVFALQVWVTPENINEIFYDAMISMNGVDILSLDLDGNDYWILESLDLKEVSIVVVEYNPLFGHKYALSVPREDAFDRNKKHHSNLFFGASLRAFERLLNIKNYTFVGTNRVGNNAFFVRNELCDLIPLRVRENYSDYTDWRIRESRGKNGNLNFLSNLERINEIGEMELLDVDSGKLISVLDANS
jgi:hypothetical protein